MMLVGKHPFESESKGKTQELSEKSRGVRLKMRKELIVRLSMNLITHKYQLNYFNLFEFVLGFHTLQSLLLNYQN